LKEYAENTLADVHFLFDEDMAYMVNENGDLVKLDEEFFRNSKTYKSS
jgi:hypothetical protein